MFKLTNRTKVNYRSKRLWTALSALILLVLQSFGVEVVEESYNELINAILTVLVLAGFIDEVDEDDEEQE